MIGYKFPDGRVLHGTPQNALYNYVFATNGVFLEAARPEMAVCMQIARCEIRGAGEAQLASFEWKLPRVDVAVTVEAMRAARRYAMQQKEVALWLRHFDLITPTNGWHLTMPEQKQTYASCKPYPGQMQYQDVIIELHSHHVMPARFSTIDDAEVGRNKAVTLAARFSLAWGIEIQAIPARFSAQTLERNGNDLAILLGCVDNAAGRKAIHDTLHQHTKLNGSIREWWLDCGNAEDSGQVYFGGITDRQYLAKKPFVSDRVCVKLPAPSLVDPELLKARPEEVAGKKLSCAEVQLANVQSLSVNQQVAAIASDYLLRLITGTLTKYATFFDLQSGSMRSKYITRENLRKYRESEQ